MRITYYLVAVLLGLIVTTHAHSSWEMRTDFRAVVTTDVLDRSVQQNYKAISGDDVFQVPDFQVMSNGIPVTVSGIYGRIQYVVGTPQRSGTGLVWDSSSDKVRVDLAIQKISAFTMIRKEFDGGAINIRVEGSCDNVRMSIPPQAGAKIFAQVKAILNNGNLTLATVSSNVDWPENSWQMDNLTCTGVEGFGAAVRTEALKVMAKPQKDVQAGLYTAIQKRLDSWAGSAMNVAIAPRLIFDSRSDIVMQSNPANMAAQSDGNILMDGTFRVIMPSVGGDAINVVSTKFLNAASGAIHGSETQIPVSSLRNIIMGTLFAKGYSSSWSSFDFKPFYSLMQDRTAQAYAFPDLQKYDKEAHFIFQTAAFSAPTLKNLRVGTAPDTLLGDISGPVQIQMLAPRAELKKNVPYVQFTALVRGTAQFKIVDGKLAVQIQNAKVDLTSAWDANYLATYKPNTKIANDLIASKLSASLAGQGFTLGLPYWQWQNNQRLIPVALGLEGEQVKLLWDVVAAPPAAATGFAQAP